MRRLDVPIPAAVTPVADSSATPIPPSVAPVAGEASHALRGRSLAYLFAAAAAMALISVAVPQDGQFEQMSISAPIAAVFALASAGLATRSR